MLEIKELLAKFESILLTESNKKKLIREAIFRSTAIDITDEKVEIKGTHIFLKIKPIYKNEILLKQKEILQDLSQLKKTRITKIR